MKHSGMVPKRFQAEKNGTFWNRRQTVHNLSKQNTLYKGMHFILFSNPKFLVEILIEYGIVYKVLNTFKLFDLVCVLDFTSIGIMFPNLS